MKGSQWIGGVRPKHVVPTDLIVLGPNDYDNQKFLWRRLDRIVVTEVDVVVHTIEAHDGNKVWDKKTLQWKYVGVNVLAQRWATYHWYDRKIYHPTRYSEGGYTRVLLEMIESCPERALVASWRRYLTPGGGSPLPGWDNALEAILERNFRIRYIG
jgi:hypothetical protein